MKQTQFLVEIIVNDDKTTIIFRANNGAVAAVCDNAPDANLFLTEVVGKLHSSSNS